MAWNPNIPQPTDLLSQSQADILANFQALDPLFNGIDNFVLLPAQGGSPATAANEVALFSRTSTETGATELAIRKQADGAAYEFSGSLNNANGWTRLPSGILLKWGQTTGAALAGNSWTQVLYPVAPTIPVFTSIFSVQLTPKVVTPQPSTAQTTTLLDLDPNYNTTGFFVFCRRTDAGGGIAADCTYLAIGM